MYDFKEMEITFPPTYRYHMGSNPREYNPKKGRVPSWCDRILWHSLPGLKLNTGEYNCNMSITTSDHAPVYATFTADWVPPLFVTNSGDLYTAPSCVLEFVKMRAKNLARHHHGKSSGEESGRRIDPFLTMWLFSFNEWPVHSAVVKNVSLSSSSPSCRASSFLTIPS
jgi:hypothetical protein